MPEFFSNDEKVYLENYRGSKSEPAGSGNKLQRQKRGPWRLREKGKGNGPGGRRGGREKGRQAPERERMLFVNVRTFKPVENFCEFI